ncbi:MAG TPA: VOC family protein [Acidimicrobiia bacterium]|nr:VOC family protein [Acidimicrobiia bacterium]
MAERIELDHVALAAADTADALRFLTGALGGTVLFGGQTVGFRPMQVWVGPHDASAGMAVELLEPWATEHNDFLERFVRRQGAGPHHLTFKVPDLQEALARVRASGRTPVKIDLSDPGWMEAFVMPAEAHGTVVQVAQADVEFPDRRRLLDHVLRHGVDGNPRWWVDPEPSTGPPAVLRRVVLGTPDVEGAVAFFGGVLDGDTIDERDGGVELAWDNGSRLRVESRERAGVDRLEVEGLARDHDVIGTRFAPAP